MQTLDINGHCTPFAVPGKVAVCPICGAEIYVEEISEWECDSGKPVSISVECSTEPDIDSDDWRDWHRWHWSMPYVDWLPVEMRVLKWVQREFRCV